MRRIKDVFFCVLYILIIFLSQKIVYYIYSFVVFMLASSSNSFISRMYFSSHLSSEEKALLFIRDTQTIYIFLGWALGLLIIYGSFKFAKLKPMQGFIKPLGINNLLLGIIVGFGIVLLTNGIVNTMRSFYAFSNSIYGFELGDNNVIIIILVVGILTPIFEELVFRGFIMERLLENGDKWYAIIIQTLLFSLSHLNLVQGISVFLLGIATGYGTIKTKSIKTGMVIHIVFNLTNLYLYKIESFYNFGQLIVFILLGLVLTYLGFEKLRVKV